MSNTLRKLRIAFSAVCGIVCLLSIALWVRSNTTRDTGFWPGTSYGVQISSMLGRVVVIAGPPGPIGDGFIFYQAPAVHDATFFERDILGFYFERTPIRLRFDVPLWFIALISLAIATVPWLRANRRFSLRTLLAATTLIAVLLGAIVYAVR
jgi:hypothetical protein